MRAFIENKEEQIPEKTTLLELAKDYRSEYEGDILLAKVNGALRELYHTVQEGDHVSFLTIADKSGYETYRRSCSMLFLAALENVTGKEGREKVILHFSVQSGFYYTLEGSIRPDEKLLEEVTGEMNRMVSEGIPFVKTTIRTREARELFHKLGMTDKERLFRTRLASTVNIYNLNGYVDYYYGYMVHDTSVLKSFRLSLYRGGIVLQMPEYGKKMTIPLFEPSEKLFDAQIQGEKWAERQGIETVGNLNEQIIYAGARHTILVSEALMEREIARTADQIADRKNVRFVMIAGPSSSGKTTFSQRLAIQLSAIGLTPHYIGVDNYFKNRDTVPLDEFGQKDFESLRAVDVEQFNRDMTAVLKGGTIKLPTFDFMTGRRVYNGETLTLSDGDVLIIEGIHCLNDALSYSLPEESKFKIYISALTQVNLDEHDRIASTDGRLLRRIVRDNRTRGYSASATLAMWDSVRRGEEKYIFPYQESADVFFNSALAYEIAALKPYAQPLLFQVQEDDPQYAEARRLLKFLDYSIAISSDEDIPNNSLLREFIGGGCFHL